MGATALPRGAGQHRRDRLLQALVRIGDDQLHTGQPTGHQVTQKRRPARAVLAGEHVYPEDLPVAIGVTGGGHHTGDIDDPAGLPALDGQRIQPHIGIGAGVQWPGPERRHLAVQGLGQLRDLRLRQALDTQRRHQPLHPPGRHPTHIALGDHRDQGPFASPARLQQPVRKVAASPKLGDLELQGADPGVQPPSPVAVALVHPIRAPLAQPSTAQGVGLGPHQRLHKAQHHLPQQIRVGCLKVLAQPAHQVHRRCDHRAFFTCSAKNLVRMTRWSSSLWDLGLLQPSYTTSVDANLAVGARLVVQVVLQWLAGQDAAELRPLH